MLDAIPKRYVLTAVALAATTLSITLQTNLSLAIVYMVETVFNETTSISTPNECSTVRLVSINSEKYTRGTATKFDWNTEIQGLTIALQFLGMVCGYIPGGRLGELHGVKRTMICTMLLASLFTILSPIAAELSVYLFMVVRFMVGIGSAPVFPLLVVMISKWIPNTEQSFIASIMLAGFGTGAFVSYLVSGVLCSSEFLGGWPSVFYLSGIAGIAWCALCFFCVFESPDDHPTISFNELEYIGKNIGSPVKKMKTIPWKSMITSIPVWTIAVGTFGQYWLLAFYVTSHSMYLGTVLNLDNSIVACLGFTGVIFAGCDVMLNTIAFVLGGLCGDFVIFGVVLVPTDIAPSLGGMVQGFIKYKKSSWNQSLRQWRYIYYCTIGVTIVTTLIYVIFGTSDPQPWATEEDEDSSVQKESQEQNKQTLTNSNSKCNSLEYHNHGTNHDKHIKNISSEKNHIV
ncbi:putative inorganic phosphate cotransporter like protein [Argiope bruennichi]|uniref:Putative inorganic phosphate cotransporter like protein n=1 Tax=Argiope bruennichi TaxID=94029 RepID=A0A8T0EJ10_ARGBR|nr:putative inorganic phosphate cotransporter like protein [Argiope bruennichi]